MGGAPTASASRKNASSPPSPPKPKPSFPPTPSGATANNLPRSTAPTVNRSRRSISNKILMLNHLAKVSNRPPIMHSLAHNRRRAVHRTLRTTTVLRLLDGSVPQPSPTLRPCHHPIPRRLHISRNVRRVHLNRSTLTQTQQLSLEVLPPLPSRPRRPMPPITRHNRDLRVSRQRRTTRRNRSHVGLRPRVPTATTLRGRAAVHALKGTRVPRVEQAMPVIPISDRPKICRSEATVGLLHHNSSSSSNRVSRPRTVVEATIALP